MLFRSERGILVNPNVEKDMFSGIARVKSYLNRKNGLPNIYIFENCPHLISELKGHYWGSGDLPADEKREFVSELVDFGDILAGYSEGFDWRGGYMGKAKKLKTLTLYGEGCLQVEVHDGKEWHAWEIEDLPQKLTLNIGLRGEAFRFRFVLEKDAKVRGMALQAEALE